jgi:hypothetical protein
MKPMPNNGTLRLPLKPVGLHDSQTTLEAPADPEPTPAAVESVTGVMSISPIETSSAADANEGPPAAVGVDPPDEPNEPEENDGEDGDDKFDSIGDFWDWFTGKLDHLWGKLTGSKEDSKSS